MHFRAAIPVTSPGTSSTFSWLVVATVTPKSTTSDSPSPCSALQAINYPSQLQPLPEPTALTSAPGALQDFPLHKYRTHGAAAAHDVTALQDAKGRGNMPLLAQEAQQALFSQAHSLHPPLQGTLVPPSPSTMEFPLHFLPITHRSSRSRGSPISAHKSPT